MLRSYRPLVMAAAVLALLTAGCSQAAKPAVPAGPSRLADCVGHPQVRPAMVIVRCADTSLTARNLKWSDWGAPVATATGTAVINNCEFQDCHTGSYSAHRVVLVVSGALACPKGGRAYAKIQTMFVGSFDAWTPSQANQIVARPCGSSAPLKPHDEPSMVI
jgi:hypothetical protein